MIFAWDYLCDFLHLYCRLSAGVLPLSMPSLGRAKSQPTNAGAKSLRQRLSIVIDGLYSCNLSLP